MLCYRFHNGLTLRYIQGRLEYFLYLQILQASHWWCSNLMSQCGELVLALAATNFQQKMSEVV